MAIEKRLGNPKRSAKLGGPIGKLKIKAKPSTSYSPAPMSAAAKAKAAAAGAKTAAKIKNPMGLKKMNLDAKAKNR